MYNYYTHQILNIKALDLESLVQNSVFNHHVNGMNYLCLERSEHKTVKIYYCNGVGNTNGGYLVHPHNHRYPFNSTVLKGTLHHLRFKESDCHGDLMTKNSYNWKTKELEHISNVCLYPRLDDLCNVGDSYYVKTDEYHTLKLISSIVVIGLIQYADQIEDAVLYKKADVPFKIPNSYTPTVEQYLQQLNEVRFHLGI